MQENLINEFEQLLTLDVTTGKLFWKDRPHNKRWSSRYAGKEAFTAKGPDNRYRGSINNKSYLKSFIVFCLFNKILPLFTIDHMDRNKENGNPLNLRDVPRSIQENNKAKTSRGNSRYKGVCYITSKNRWRARLVVNGKTVLDRRVRSEQEAQLLYKHACVEHNIDNGNNNASN